MNGLRDFSETVRFVLNMVCMRYKDQITVLLRSYDKMSVHRKSSPLDFENPKMHRQYVCKQHLSSIKVQNQHFEVIVNVDSKPWWKRVSKHLWHQKTCSKNSLHLKETDSDASPRIYPYTIETFLFDQSGKTNCLGLALNQSFIPYTQPGIIIQNPNIPKL